MAENRNQDGAERPDQSGSEHAIQPIVFVGIGGTGLKVLARFRRKLYERFGTPDGWPTMAFLYIDSDQADLARATSEAYGGKPLRERDRLDVSMDAGQVRGVFQQLESEYSHVSQWLSRDVTQFADKSFTNGARQHRNLGRMLFTYHIERVERAIIDRCQLVRSTQAMADARQMAASRGFRVAQTVGAPPVHVVMVASTAGGTGAGAFLDFAYLCRHIAAAQPGLQLGHIRAYLVMADVFEDRLKERSEAQLSRTFANSYASLLEIEHFNNFPTNLFDCSAWGRRFQSVEDARVLGRPFDICYVLNAWNRGGRLGTPDRPADEEVYDLLAETLEFSVSNDPLARRLASNWSNESAVYENRWELGQVPAKTPELGGRLPDEATSHTFKAYSLAFSQRYSSLGISRVTLMLPQLRRLAAIHIQRLWIADEVGKQPDDESNVALREDARTHKRTIESSGEFLSERLAKARREIEAGILERSSSSREASRLSRALLESFDILAQLVLRDDAVDLRVPPSSRALVGEADDLLRRARADAERVAANVVDKESSRPLRSRIAILRMLAHMLRSEAPVQPAKPNHAAAARPWEVNWADVEQNFTVDPFGLGDVAIRILREKSARWTEQWCEQYAEAMSASLRRLRDREVGELLDLAAKDAERDLGTLSDFLDRLLLQQRDLASAFLGQRNFILTRDLASPGEDGKDQALERQIRAVVPNLSEVKREVLAAYAAEASLASSPANMLQVSMTTPAQRPGGRVDLVDIVARSLLSGFPQPASLYAKLAELSNWEANVGSAVSRASALWPPKSDLPNTRNLEESLLAGTTQVVSSDTRIENRARELEEILRNGDIELIKTPATSPDAAATSGELVIVSEHHGYMIPSLNTLGNFKRRYKEFVMERGLRHIDARFSFLGSLPTFEQPSDEVMLGIVSDWEAAFLGIILGIVAWNEPKRIFMYAASGPTNWQDCGDTLFTVANALRGPRLDTVRAAVQSAVGDIHSWLLGSSPEERTLGAQNLAFYLQLSELACDRVFPLPKTSESIGSAARVSQGEDPMAEPLHTLARRIRFRFLRLKIAAVEQGLESELAELDSQLRPALHQYVQFVGRPGHRQLDGTFVPSKHRMLAALAKDDTHVSPHDAQDVIREAFLQGWFPEEGSPEGIRSLFPEPKVPSRGNMPFGPRGAAVSSPE